MPVNRLVPVVSSGVALPVGDAVLGDESAHTRFFDVLSCGHRLPYTGTQHIQRRCPDCGPVDVLADQLGLELGSLVDSGNRGTIQERFEAFHDANPWVYAALCKLTADLVARGRDRVGIGMLWEVLRWSYERSTVDSSGSGFKLNDHFRSRYARRIAEENPQWAHLFRTRQLRAA